MCDLKHIHPKFLHLSKNLTQFFITGFIYSHEIDYKNNMYILDMSKYTESSKHILSYLLTKLYISNFKIIQDSVYIEMSKLKNNKKMDMNISDDKKYIYRKISKITKKIQQKQILYDLEFKKEHSYVTTCGTLHNGGGKRKGSFAIYIEPWHADIMDFLMAKRNIGDENERARDLFYGLWIPDLFMQRVEENGIWSLMCPDQSPGLNLVYGKEFNELYEKYENIKQFVYQLPAREIWKEILHSQIETGLPYMLYKDSCNLKSNQKNIGTIQSSNLCTEIIQYSSKDEYAVCNLASINLSQCVSEKNLSSSIKIEIYTKKDCIYCKLLKSKLHRKNVNFIEYDIEIDIEKWKTFKNLFPDSTNTVPQIVINSTQYFKDGYSEFFKKFLSPSFDFIKLGRLTEILVDNMNKIIDKNYYPTKETELSNKSHRPIGIGVQGLADLFCKLGLPFDSIEAKKLNYKIFETIYFHALSASNQSSISLKKTYSSFPNSPLSHGIFHFDLCPNFNPTLLSEKPIHNWNDLRFKIQTHGVMNSLFIAPMPTASTSQILYQNECFEPFTSNLYVRRTLAGEFTICNKYLVQDLIDIGLWNQETIDHLIIHKGSIQQFSILPISIRQIYRTAWEIPQKSLIDMAVERQWFIDQSQSFNLFIAQPSLEKLTKMHFYGWKNGLKTGSYYVRTKPQHFSQNFTIDPTKETCTECTA